MGVADAEHDLGAGLGQRAAHAGGGLVGDQPGASADTAQTLADGPDGAARWPGWPSRPPGRPRPRPGPWPRRPGRRRRRWCAPGSGPGRARRGRPGPPGGSPPCPASASVAITPIVVLPYSVVPTASSTATGRCGATGSRVPSSIQPTALTATRADTVTPSARTVAVPRPPGTAVLAAEPLARSSRPAPAPTRPTSTGPPAAARVAAAPPSGPGRTAGSPLVRSNRPRPTTIGTGPPGVSRPTPSPPSTSSTPSTAARPKTERPLSTHGVEPGDRLVRGQQDGVPGGRRPAPELPRGHRAVGEADHRAPGGAVRGGPVPDPHAGHVGDHRPILAAGPPEPAGTTSADGVRSARWRGDGTDREAIAEALPGYDVEGVLGQGAMGVVLGGRHRKLDRMVAIKQLPPAVTDDAEARERFGTEARTLASLDPPPHRPGLRLRRARGPLPPGHGGAARRHGLGPLHRRRPHARRPPAPSPSPPAPASQHAHDQHVLHRDIKPENLLFAADQTLKVTDFGIAEVLGGDQTLATAEGAVVGTPAYMAPEQASGGAARRPPPTSTPPAPCSTSCCRGACPSAPTTPSGCSASA